MCCVRLRIALLLALAASAAFAQRSPATGPLRLNPANPHWFLDASGKAVLLAGSHTWQNLQDSGLLRPDPKNPPDTFDYKGFLDTLERHNHNFFRLWRWEVPKWKDSFDNTVKYAQPHPWVRSGPGMARDGKPKFDIKQFDPEYFKRMRDRVTMARDRGFYVAVMLFEGWAFQHTDAWEYHPFHRENNVNNIEADTNGDGKGLEYVTLQPDDAGRAVLEHQLAYVRKVVDTVNDLDNVVYEISNEAGAGSTDWQYYIIRYVRHYERSKPKQHPVGMTFQFNGGTNNAVFASPADWISPNPGDPAQSYTENPPPDVHGKVVVNDTDHLWGHTGGDAVWVWKSFLRGLNVLLMEQMLPSPTWQDSARKGMGQARRYADRVNLAAMKPANELAETRYCLTDRKSEFLVFQNGSKGEFSVNLKEAPGTFKAEWLDVNADRVVPAGKVEGGAMRTFTTPFGGPAVLLLQAAK
jgi:hypothetical protein